MAAVLERVHVLGKIMKWCFFYCLILVFLLKLLCDEP